ncbi:DUF5983 family protein, partial [Komagataeibacter europaeus]
RPHHGTLMSHGGRPPHLDPYSHDWPGSRSLRAILALARNHDCDYVLFDADGPVDASLRFFDDDEDE